MGGVVEGEDGVVAAGSLRRPSRLVLRGPFIHGVVPGRRDGILDELVHVEPGLEEAVVHRAQGGAEPVVFRAIGGCVVQSVGELGDEPLWFVGEDTGIDPQSQL